jgi:hypothetical protein
VPVTVLSSRNETKNEQNVQFFFDVKFILENPVAFCVEHEIHTEHSPHSGQQGAKGHCLFHAVIPAILHRLLKNCSVVGVAIALLFLLRGLSRFRCEGVNATKMQGTNGGEEEGEEEEEEECTCAITILIRVVTRDFSVFVLNGLKDGELYHSCLLGGAIAREQMRTQRSTGEGLQQKHLKLQAQHLVVLSSNRPRLAARPNLRGKKKSANNAQR